MLINPGGELHVGRWEGALKAIPWASELGGDTLPKTGISEGSGRHLL